MKIILLKIIEEYNNQIASGTIVYVLSIEKYNTRRPVRYEVISDIGESYYVTESMDEFEIIML